MIPALPEITLVFTSLFIQGLPFLFLGAFVSGIVSTFLPIQKLIAWMPKHPLKSAAVGILAGFIFPTCECVGVPLIRRLTMKGLPLSAALTYLFVGPAVNPIALTSTWLAFSFEGPLQAVLIRITGAIIVALILALTLNRMGKMWVLKPEILAAPTQNSHVLDTPFNAAPWFQTKYPRLASALQITLSDFLNVSFFYLIGALASAVVQTSASAFLGQTGLGSASIPFMMMVAVVSSVCSSADAFVAKSYISMSQAALFAFLWIGPVLDLKLMIVYQSFFQRRAILLLAALAICSVLILALLFNELPQDFFYTLFGIYG